MGKKVKFRDVVLKLNDDVYMVCQKISNWEDYKINDMVTINNAYGKVVGYGLHVFIIEVSE